jgi:DNA replication and repair protein RecF
VTSGPEPGPAIDPLVLAAEQLWLTDFRNYREVDVTLAPGLTVVVGANGQGKTNLIEALGYAATARSFRGVPPEALVRTGCASAVVRASGVRAGRSFLIEADIRPGGKGRLQLNRQRVARARDLADALVVSVFTPDDLVVIKGGPSERRRYLDETIVALHPRNDALRADLERILRQKGALLKQARGRVSDDVRTTLDVWNRQLAEVGERFVAARLDALDALRPRLGRAYADISGIDAELEIGYLSGWRAEGLAAALAGAEADEIRRGVCLVGPQRDDLGITLSGLPSRTHASQGEQRTLALALRLGAHRLIADTLGVAPVLLLDDIFSELDPARSAALLAHLPVGQVVLTTAGDLPADARPDLVLRVQEGRLL